MKIKVHSLLLPLFTALTVVCLFVSFATCAEAARYQHGTLLKTQTCGSDLCRTVVIQGGEIVYVASQNANLPWHAYAPHEFVENGDLEFRVDGGNLYLKRPNGKELKMRLTRRVKIDPKRFLQEANRDEQEDNPHAAQSTPHTGRSSSQLGGW